MLQSSHQSSQGVSTTFTVIFKTSEIEEKNGKETRDNEGEGVCVRYIWGDGVCHVESAGILTYFHHSDFVIN